ncbi:iron-sulfur cluster biosynthesis family protein [Vagococcus zengguangii]|uniref:Iron-sulfur cluster biosynthesis family protein n=1 Tax=Vagococcus zengguangii TaxID=2571750 RepID=A0A4D7CNW8_9ENTE|nr:iron-sulfur cluster biosynthesis family protein [Vagococcus zengguangii]QCI85759.1 iron-sulfur cluster biosynthesis family protein [Vagococcus zengguangii]TLG81700.1 iron-sulfur cluster biosynthesis family protein [Vagococcus zengguangii]
MRLTITEAVLEKLGEKITPDAALYLDFIDGDSPGYQGAISCTLAVAFRFLIVTEDKEQPAFDLYQTKLTSNVGEIGVKASSLRYLEDEMRLDFNPSTYRYQLKGDSGILADQVAIECM